MKCQGMKLWNMYAPAVMFDAFLLFYFFSRMCLFIPTVYGWDKDLYLNKWTCFFSISEPPVR